MWKGDGGHTFGNCICPAVDHCRECRPWDTKHIPRRFVENWKHHSSAGRAVTYETEFTAIRIPPARHVHRDARNPGCSWMGGKQEDGTRQCWMSCSTVPLSDWSRPCSPTAWCPPRTCEQRHWPEKVNSFKMRVDFPLPDDRQQYPDADLLLMMLTGRGNSGRYSRKTLWVPGGKSSLSSKGFPAPDHSPGRVVGIGPRVRTHTYLAAGSTLSLLRIYQSISDAVCRLS